MLASVPEIEVLRRSRCYRSAPWGLPDQPDFVNAVAELETGLQPLPLLRLLLKIEISLGRERQGPQWGPRCIDLDVLTYDELRLESAELILPHPHMHQRAFVLVPLLELEPDFVIPGRGTAAECLEQINPSERAEVEPMPFPPEVHKS